MSFSNSRRLGVALLITAALVAAGCGSSKTAAPATTVAPATTAAPTATTAAPAATTAAPAATTAAPAATTAAPAATTAAPADPLGKPNAAKGTPLKVGYIWSGVSAAIDNSEDLAAAQATAKWVNEYQGGVAGHPLELIPCATNEDPAIAAACGTQMVEAGVPAVLFNVNGQVGPWAKIVTAAKIPIIAFSTADPSVLAPGLDVFTLTNPIAGISSFPADLAKKAGYTKAAIIVIDVPGATGPVKAMAPPLFAAQGVPAVDLVAIAPGTADMSPQVQAELQKDPQGVHIIGNPAFCATAVKALRDASFKGTISMISNCLDPATIKALGTSLKGIVVSYAAGEKPDDPDYSAFKALAAKYSPDKKITPSGTPVGGFVVILGFSRMLAALKGDVTSASITTQIRANGPLPAPTLGAGKTFLCDGKQVPGITIACVKGIAYATLDDKGVAGDFGAF